jgi:MFS family permease
MHSFCSAVLAMLLPNSLAIRGQTFSGEAKRRAIGFCAARGAATAAIGPVLGGWLIDIDATLWVAAPLSAVMLIARRPCP